MRSVAAVDLEGSTLCARRLVAYLARRHGGHWCEQHQRGWVDLGFGRVELSRDSHGLVVRADGDLQDLDRLEDIVGRHLLRFADGRHLAVQWERQDGPGSIQVSPVWPALRPRS
jgi:hypothetical protein